MINRISADECQRVFPQYFDLALARLLEFELSTNDRLFATALDSIVEFASWANVEEIVLRIFWSDWLDELVVTRRFLLLAELASHFRTPLFGDLFIDLCYELLPNLTTNHSVSNIFAFLSRIPIKHLPQEIRDFAFNFVGRNYCLYRQCGFKAKNYAFEMPTDTFLDTIDTDIVTNPTIDHTRALVHILNCYEFLCSLDAEVLGDLTSLFDFSTVLIPIFEVLALKTLLKLVQMPDSSFKIAPHILEAMFISVSNDEVLAIICEFFMASQTKLLPTIEGDIKKYLTDQVTVDCDLLFRCFMLVDQSDHELAIAQIPQLKKRLPVSEGAVLLFKLVLVAGPMNVNDFDGFYGLSLIGAALARGGGVFAEKVRDFLNSVPFWQWPIDDRSLNKALIDFLENEPLIRLSDFEKIDMKHWLFIMEHSNSFDLTGVAEFIQKNPKKFAKLDVSKFVPLPKRGFVYVDVEASKLPSSAVFFKQNCYVKSLALAQSYFRNSFQPISQELFCRYLEIAKSLPHWDFFLDLFSFGIRTGQVIDLNSDFFFQKQVFDQTLRYLAKVGSISKIEPEIVQRIERVLGRELKPEIIHETRDVNLVKLDPDYFLDYLFEFEEYRAHRFLPLCYLLMGVPFSIVRLLELVRRFIGKWGEWRSVRKRTVFIRFLSSCLFCAQPQRFRHGKEIGQLIQEIDNNFAALTSVYFAAFFREISILIESMLSLAPECRCFCNFVQTISVDQVQYSMFIYSISRVATSPLKPFEKLLQSPRPSQVSACLKTVDSLLVARRVTSVRMLVPLLAENFERSSICFKMGPLMIDVIMRLLTTGFRGDLDLSFHGKIVTHFLQGRQKAIFLKAAGLCPDMSWTVPKLGSFLLGCQFVSYELVEAIEGTIRNAKEALKNPKKEECFEVEAFEAFHNYFSLFTTKDTCELFARIATININISSFFYTKLPMSANNFFVLYVFLRKLFKEVNEQEQANVKTVVEASVFMPASRNIAMRAFSDQTQWDATETWIMAAAETDDVHGIAQELKDVSG
jgi:hypothetical protein